MNHFPFYSDEDNLTLEISNIAAASTSTFMKGRVKFIVFHTDS